MVWGRMWGMTIRIFAFAIASLALAAAEPVKQPNILFMFADDLGRYASAYADPQKPSVNDIIKTPVFDRIAHEGVLFTNAFVSSPSCTPCRGSVYTGRHFFRNGSASQLHFPWAGGAPDPLDKVVGLPMTMAKGGYHWGWTYKEHIPRHIFGGEKNHYRKHGLNLNAYSQIVSKAKDPEAAKQSIIDEVRGNFQDFLDARQAGQPFFYSFNPTNPHRTWEWGSGRKLWGLNPDDLKGKMPPFVPDNEVTREDFADYLGEAMAFDMACGELLKMVTELGEMDNTLVVISGDHGIPGYPRAKCNVTDFGARVLLAMRLPGTVEQGRRIEQPVSLIDLAPTFLAAAGMKSVDDPNGENLLPVLAKGGSEKDLRGWALIGKERHVDVGQDGFLPYPMRALRTPDFLYVINFKPDRWPAGKPNKLTEDSAPSFEEVVRNTRACFADIDASPTKAWMVQHRNDADLAELIAMAWEKRPREELYDLKKDPHQMVNLAKDPEYAAVRERMEKQLMRELEENADPRLDNDAFDRPPYLVTGRKAKGKR